MSGMEIAYSPPEARQRMHDLTETMIQLNGGLSDELRRILDKKADEFGVHRLDMEDIFKELSPVQSTSAQVRSSGSTRIDIPKGSSSVPSTIINEKDGTRLVLIPEGEFLAGGPGSNKGYDPEALMNKQFAEFLVSGPGAKEGSGPGAKEGSGHSFPVRLPAYYLALYPVTNIQYAQFLSQVQPYSDLCKWIHCEPGSPIEHSNFYFGRKNYKMIFKLKPNGNDLPVEDVTWYGAKAYAKWAGLRLPSELEWEKGARGVDGQEYPWGNTWDESKCNNESSRVLKTCSVQSYPDGRSPWGLYQMSGNIREWCEDWYDRDAYNRYRQGKLSPPSIGTRRVLRGGHWSLNDPKKFRGASRFSGRPEARGNDCGFRLAMSLTL